MKPIIFSTPMVQAIQGGRMGFGIYENGKAQLQHDGWFTGGKVGEDSVIITHWMSLPEPPIQAGEGRGK